MNLYKAEKLAATDGASGQLCAQAALLNHKNDNFMRALEALRKTQELYAGLVLANKLRKNPSKSGIYEDYLDSQSDANVRLIAELEEVK